MFAFTAPKRARQGLAIALLWSGCTTEAPPPELHSVQPQSAPAGIATAIMVYGRDFLPVVHGDLGQPENSKIDADFELSLSSASGRVNLLNTRLINFGSLSTTVPTDAPAGLYTLELVDPRGNTARLDDSFVIMATPITQTCETDADCADDPCSESGRCEAGECSSDKDSDADGYIDAACGGLDCDDGCAQCWSGRTDTCDGLDNDCDATTPDGSAEATFGAACDGPDADACKEGTNTCDGVTIYCSDTSDDAVEVVGDGIDQDCDGAELCYVDADADGARSFDTVLSADPDCSDPGEALASASVDCDDEPTGCGAACFPGNTAPDTCDGADDDCDGQTDEDHVDSATGCGVGACSANTGTLECQGGLVFDTCDPLAGAAPDDATCDGTDDDCDGLLDEDGGVGFNHGGDAYANRQKLTLSSTLANADLSDFPYLVDISSAANPVFSSARPDGFDVLFTAADGTTKLDHEMERFDSSAGNESLVAWVRIPLLSSSQDTELFLYYGSPAAPDQSNPTGVWDSDYAGVWHMSDDPSGTVYDSTGNGLNLTVSVGMDAGDLLSAGRVGYAIEFDDAANYLHSGASNLTCTSFTFESWVGADDWSSWRSILNIDNRPDYRFFGALNGIPAMEDISGALALGPAQSGSSWRHLVAQFDGDTNPRRLCGYLDGQSTGVAAPSNFIEVTGRLIVGSFMNTDFTDFWDGVLDEVRISTVGRSADWIAASYDTQATPGAYLTLANEEASGCP